MAGHAARLVVPGEHEQVLAAGLDGVELDGGEGRHPVVADGHLRREELRVDPPDDLAPELLDEVFGGELPDLSDPRQPLDEHRVVEVRIGQHVDLDFVHGPTPRPAA